MKKHKYLFVACLSLFPVMAVAGNDTLHEIMEVPSATNINKNRLYKGKVVDDRTSEPLVGATVKVKGSTIGTITDIDGNFALDIPDNISPIVFEVSYMGYASKEAAPAKTTGFTIRLAEDSQTLEEVQIIAYGKQSKMSVTAAISSIDTKELLKSPSGSVANALSGAVTGLSSIQPSGQSGQTNQNALAVLSTARKRVNSLSKVISMVPVAPWRFLATISSVWFSSMSSCLSSSTSLR